MRFRPGVTGWLALRWAALPAALLASTLLHLWALATFCAMVLVAVLLALALE